ncbi:MAG TPA: N-6 DNA methylase [Thermoanaerobaculia bacterium]|nr:N-6 DNA methylase [Thermoanaerobaculia bacterium]
MDEIGKALSAYAREVAGVAGSSGSTEATFYPAIQRLLTAVLDARRLPFDVRTNTSQRRSAGGTDLPDLALYDGGDYVSVYGEVKTPGVEVDDLARSAEQDDQIGRYLGRTGVVLLTNVRAFGLLAVDPTYREEGPVPPDRRRLLAAVELWPSATAMVRGRAPDLGAALALAELVETAVTEFAPIAEPESLARILARQAKRAKADLPEQFSVAVQPLLDDFAKALGLTFKGPEGEEFLRSSLIQTAFYGLFASWTLWRHSREKREFEWRDLGEYLKIPFLGALFHEFRNPVRLRELGLAPHLDRATATLRRVDHERFFARFVLPHVVTGNGAVESPAAHAILYFYEPFLEAFDPELRKELGVWYTPQEIVRYQVRKVDRLLRDELDCPRGFADDRVVVLDPCCGTGAYLIEVLRCVAEQLQEEGAGAALANKLLNAFCRRIIGFEILTAPFVIAHLQLYLILSELGVEPDESHRPAIFLTNALTGWDGPEQLKLQFPELQQEHDAAQEVKREAKIIVILGNPPYNRFVGAPVKEEQELADHYKGVRRGPLDKKTGGHSSATVSSTLASASASTSSTTCTSAFSASPRSGSEWRRNMGL